MEQLTLVPFPGRAVYAFNPKDARTAPTMGPKADSKEKPEEIEEKIKRLSHTLANQVMVLAYCPGCLLISVKC